MCPGIQPNTPTPVRHQGSGCLTYWLEFDTLALPGREGPTRQKGSMSHLLLSIGVGLSVWFNLLGVAWAIGVADVDGALGGGPALGGAGRARRFGSVTPRASAKAALRGAR